MHTKKTVIYNIYNLLYELGHNWKIENKIYAIQNIKLPVSISVREASYFAVIFLVMLVAGLIIKPVSYIPTVLRFLVIPFALTKFFLKKKLDGKAPQKYFISWLAYLWTKNLYIERFAKIPKNKDNKVKLDWRCSKGNSTFLFPKTGKGEDDFV